MNNEIYKIKRILILVALSFLASCGKDEQEPNKWENISSFTIEGKSFSSIAVLNGKLLALESNTSKKNNLYQSIDNGTTWDVVLQTPYQFCTIATFGNTIYCGTNTIPAHGIFRSEDNGDTWIPTNSGLPLGPSNFFEFSDKLIADATMYVIYGKDLYSFNNGTWVSVTNSIDAAVSTFTVNGTQLFVRTSGGIFGSQNGSSNWSIVDPQFKYATAMVQIGSNLIAGNSSGLFFSSNGSGFTKAVINNQTFSPWVNCIIKDKLNVYAGTQGGRGVFVSSDNGATWTSFNEGFSDIPSVWDITENNGILYVATNHGIWKRKL